MKSANGEDEEEMAGVGRVVSVSNVHGPMRHPGHTSVTGGVRGRIHGNTGVRKRVTAARPSTRRGGARASGVENSISLLPTPLWRSQGVRASGRPKGRAEVDYHISRPHLTVPS